MHRQSKFGPHAVYRYDTKSDYYPTVLPWTPVLRELRDLIEKVTGQRCNHLVLNRYKNGEDHIGFHDDKTRDFADGTHVFTISLGAVRTFRIQDKDDVTVAEVGLEHG
jgi:alkylated DNA repair dioxygenase AlkB